MGWVLWHINYCRSFNDKFSLSMYINYIGFLLVGFHDISTIVGYLMLNSLNTYILDIYDLVRLGFMAYQPLLFNATSSLYICIKYISFGGFEFYGISTIVGYLIPNLIYTFIFNIYDLVWLGFMAY